MCQFLNSSSDCDNKGFFTRIYTSMCHNIKYKWPGCFTELDINIGKSIYYRLTLIIKQHF